MNDDEFSATMHLLASTFPNYDLPVETVKIWRAALDRYQGVDAWNAAEWICLNDERFPPLARMRERVQHEARRSAVAELGTGSGSVDPAPFVAAIKRVLRPVSHDHKKGVAGCPTCRCHDHSHGSAQCPRCREIAGEMRV